MEKWGGGPCPYSYSFGWLTGRDNDLVCVKANLRTPLEGEAYLSPVCSIKLLALLAFVLKNILVRIDYKLRSLEG